jgi:Ca2+-binding EF-hand superfamily protein
VAIEMSLEDAEAQIAKHNEDGNGQIEFSEFVQVVMGLRRQDNDTSEQVQRSFKELAGNHDTITEEQLRQLMETEDVFT